MTSLAGQQVPNRRQTLLSAAEFPDNIVSAVDVEAAIAYHPLTISPTGTVAEVVRLMSAQGNSCALVCDMDAFSDQMLAQTVSSCVLVTTDNYLVGIVTERDLVRLSGTQQDFFTLMVSEIMTASPIFLRRSEFTNLFVPLQILRYHGVRHLPLVDDHGVVVGLVTHDSLRQLLRPIDLLHIRTASEVMNTTVIHALPTATIGELTHLMQEHQISSVVIVADSLPLRPIGIVTERDIVQWLAMAVDFAVTTAETVMSTPILSVLPQASLWSVRMLMQEQQINRLVVTDEAGHLQGIVTQSSLLQILNPMEIYRMMEVLEQKVCQLEAERIDLLTIRNQELETYQQHLEQTNAELIRATGLKDEFLANMSHELRTPLNAILGLSEGLQEEVFGAINEKQRNSLSIIERSGSHLLKLINDILEVSKIAAGKLELYYTSVAIEQLCTVSMSFVKQQAYQKRIQLVLDIPDDLGSITVDERRMQQVLINLLTNAVKFTPEGGRIELKVYSDSVPCQDPNLCFAILDTGIGIASEHFTKLFEPFIQIDSNLNRQYTGTGLGLALVKQIVELHGGSVRVESQKGLGSCFTVTLPWQGQKTVTAAITSLPVPPVAEPACPKTAPLILLAEDNEANINTISAYLEAKGYRLLLARDGLEAIDLTHNHQPDLILMDIQMPKMDGLVAMKHIRSELQQTQTPMVALTALAMPGDREKFLAAGANEYLSKPVKLKELFVTIERLLELSRGRSFA